MVYRVNKSTIKFDWVKPTILVRAADASVSSKCSKQFMPFVTAQ